MNRIHLGDAELDMLALRRELPIEGRGDAFAFERVGERLARKQTAAIDPGAEIGRHRDVWGRGDDTRGERRLLAGDLIEQRTETLLRRHFRLDRDRKVLWNFDARRGQIAAVGLRERHAIEEPLDVGFGLAQALEAIPFVSRPDIHRLAKAFHLRRRHQTGVIVLMPGKRQPIAFDGVGDEADRAVVINGVKRCDDRRKIVAAEIVHQAGQLIVAAGFNEPRHRALVADLVEQALAPRRAALEHQRRIKLVRAVIDPLPQHFAARLGKGGLLQRAVFENDNVPAEIAEQILVALPQTLAHHGVEALPVIVDDPPAIAQALLPAFEDRLENIALVELGVAEKRDHAAFRPLQSPAMGAHIILGERRE